MLICIMLPTVAQILHVGCEFKIPIHIVQQLLQSMCKAILIGVTSNQLNSYLVALNGSICILMRIALITVDSTEFLHNGAVSWVDRVTYLIGLNRIVVKTLLFKQVANLFQ